MAHRLAALFQWAAKLDACMRLSFTVHVKKSSRHCTEPQSTRPRCLLLGLISPTDPLLHLTSHPRLTLPFTFATSSASCSPLTSAPSIHVDLRSFLLDSNSDIRQQRRTAANIRDEIANQRLQDCKYGIAGNPEPCGPEPGPLCRYSRGNNLRRARRIRHERLGGGD
jgi:hypothetical protein